MSKRESTPNQCYISAENDEFHLRFEPPINNRKFYDQLVTSTMHFGGVQMAGKKKIHEVNIAPHYVKKPSNKVGKLLTSRIRDVGYELIYVEE